MTEHGHNSDKEHIGQELECRTHYIVATALFQVIAKQSNVTLMHLTSYRGRDPRRAPGGAAAAAALAC
ncbi:hypothetical protein MSG28_007566 [Choristoneura fumiferana]|uniref:Uncharacterized protein n=1 Tax=Choristoneura fumiferana TaxID=7141 RepID=A0ACC0JXP1_CHOFU|nr:hypothetical protein MSG28_007566 [Choristoneura fumiferana]